MTSKQPVEEKNPDPQTTAKRSPLRFLGWIVLAIAALFVLYLAVIMVAGLLTVATRR